MKGTYIVIGPSSLNRPLESVHIAYSDAEGAGLRDRFRVMDWSWRVIFINSNGQVELLRDRRLDPRILLEGVR